MKVLAIGTYDIINPTQDEIEEAITKTVRKLKTHVTISTFNTTLLVSRNAKGYTISNGKTQSVYTMDDLNVFTLDLINILLISNGFGSASSSECFYHKFAFSKS